MSAYQLDRQDGSPPIYHQIKAILMTDIRSDYQSGEKLPSEGEMALKFGVNRHTLRRAIDELVADGVVERRHGVGVIVVQPTIDYAIGQQTRFTATLESQGHQATTEVLNKSIIPARGGVAARLQLPLGSEVIAIETLRSVNRTPFCIISHFFPRAQCEAVYQDYDGGSLHDFLRARCDLTLTRSESLISAVLPEVEDARRLAMPKHEPILRVKSMNICEQRQIPIEYVVTRFRGKSAQLSIRP